MHKQVHIYSGSQDKRRAIQRHHVSKYITNNRDSVEWLRKVTYYAEKMPPISPELE